MSILAIDPGPTFSGVCIIDEVSYKPIKFGKYDNEKIFDELSEYLPVSHVVIEMIGHYGTGMPAGKDVFDTCVWIGRFIEQFVCCCDTVETLPRQTVKMHLCQSTRAKDANILQALVDRFAPGQKNHGKGTKKNPGWFYGFSADVWAAYALGITYIDMRGYE